MEIFEASLSFNEAGHEGQYVVRVDDEERPFVARRLQTLLIGWDVCNRDGAILISSAIFGYGLRNDFEIVAALREIVVNVKLNEEMTITIP